MTADELYAKAESLKYSTRHDEDWRNEIAADLNTMLGRISYQLETDGDDSDVEWASAELRIIERVAEFEEIETEAQK